MAGAWGCPHEQNDVCTKVNNLPCDPGMKGCILAGRYMFFSEGDDAKNERLRIKRAREAAQAGSLAEGDDTKKTEPVDVSQDEQK